MEFSRRVRLAAALLLCITVAGCSRLTDPKYEFITLAQVDGKPLPVTIRFGPDSLGVTIKRGRLGLSNASLSLSCRIEFEYGSSLPLTVGTAYLTNVDCEPGSEGAITIDAQLNDLFSDYVIRSSGSHRFSFSGRVRTKTPGF